MENIFKSNRINDIDIDVCNKIHVLLNKNKYDLGTKYLFFICCENIKMQ